jgi:hypothetical protein
MIVGKNGGKLSDDWVMICTPRTASTSLSMMLNLVPASEETPGRYFGHTTAFALASNFGFSNWRKVFSFGFVRNPWSRVVSICASINPKMLKSKESFEQWLLGGMLNQDGKLHMVTGKTHISLPCSAFVLPCTYVGRYETFREDVNRICCILGRPAIKEWLHVQNSKLSISYKELYTDFSRNYIARVYREDVAAFGYTFNELV